MIKGILSEVIILEWMIELDEYKNYNIFKCIKSQEKVYTFLKPSSNVLY